MIQENELVTLIVGFGVLLFFVTAQSRLREFPAWRTFTAAFCVYVCGWILTVLEGLWAGFAAELLLASLFNAAEHICYTVSSLLLTVWCWRAFCRGGKVRS